MKKAKKWIVIALACLLGSAILSTAAVLLINAYVKNTSSARILSLEQAAALEEVDCILVLGCLVKADGTPSHMLEDRIKVGVSLYQSSASAKILMSGDHGRQDYDEVNVMKSCAIAAGVPSEDVFMDHAGFSTYESIVRAKEIFGADKIIIVTQEYHLYRALYIAESMGIEAYGVSADLRTYSGQTKRDLREVLARIKDVGYCILSPAPTYLGTPISLDQSGDVTND